MAEDSNGLRQMHLIVIMALILSAVSHGFGRHWPYLNASRAVFCLKLLRISEFELIMCTIFLKISIGLFLIRLLYVLWPLQLNFQNLLKIADYEFP